MNNLFSFLLLFLFDCIMLTFFVYSSSIFFFAAHPTQLLFLSLCMHISISFLFANGWKIQLKYGSITAKKNNKNSFIILFHWRIYRFEMKIYRKLKNNDTQSISEREKEIENKISGWSQCLNESKKKHVFFYFQIDLISRISEYVTGYITLTAMHCVYDSLLDAHVVAQCAD